MASSRPTVNHYDFLDGLRAILALFVVAHHAWFTVDAYAPTKVSPCLFWLDYGRYAVCFFIVLSGFCLTLPVLTNNLDLRFGTRMFIKRRAWRILPPYYCALLLSLILTQFFVSNLTGTHWDVSLPITPHNIITHLLLIHNFFPYDPPKINHALWSIPVEWQIYFLFPLFLLGWRSIGPFWTTGTAVILSILLEKAAHIFFHIDPSAHFIGLFCAGMLAAYISFSEKFYHFPWRLAAFSALVFFIIYNCYQHMMDDEIFGCFASLLLITLTLNPNGLMRASLNFRPLVFVGSFAYSIYLIHAPLLQILWQYPFYGIRNDANQMLLVLILVGMPIIVALSYLFHLAFEKPFLRKRLTVPE